MSFITGWLSQVPYLTAILGLLQVGCIIHAITQRREFFWIWVILFLPGLGAAIYFFMEVLPTLRRRRFNLEPVRERLQNQDARIRTRSEQLAETDTFQNREALAAELTRAGRLTEAEATLQPLLTGIYREDPVLMTTLAELKYRQGQFGEAHVYLEKVDAMKSQTLNARVKLLLAEVLMQLGDPAAAERAYQDAMRGAITEEPRVKYAAFLIAQGRQDEAEPLLAQLEKFRKNGTAMYRRQEQEWFRLADQLRRSMR
jgi:hypothetical protein